MHHNFKNPSIHTAALLTQVIECMTSQLSVWDCHNDISAPIAFLMGYYTALSDLGNTALDLAIQDLAAVIAILKDKQA